MAGGLPRRVFSRVGQVIRRGHFAWVLAPQEKSVIVDFKFSAGCW